MTEGSSRRSFLKGIFNEASKRAPALMPGAPLLGSGRPAAPDTPLRPRAAPTARTASVADLRTLAVEAGLIAKLDALESLALSSRRLILAPDLQRAPLPAAAAAEPGEEPDAGDRELLFILSLDGATEHTPANAPSLTGTVTVELDHSRCCHLSLDEQGIAAPPALVTSTELVIPRVWSEEVQSLDLSEQETQAWTELRERLAAFQGVELPGELAEPPVIHRLLGYPDERTGEMPLSCELAARALAHDGPPFSHPRAAELAPRAVRWRMLLQLSADEVLDWSWGPGGERLYVWIDEADLAKGELSRTHTIIR